MNINDTPEQEHFRAEVKEWIDESILARLKGLRQGIVQGPGLAAEELEPLEQALEAKGWLAPNWPVEHGGAGFDLGQMVIFKEGCDKAGLPE